MNKSIKKYWLFPVFVLIIGVSSLVASPGGDGDGDGGEDPAVPIDGGVSILLVAGAAYGAKKVLEKRK